MPRASSATRPSRPAIMTAFALSPKSPDSGVVAPNGRIIVSLIKREMTRQYRALEAVAAACRLHSQKWRCGIFRGDGRHLASGVIEIKARNSGPLSHQSLKRLRRALRHEALGGITHIRR